MWLFPVPYGGRDLLMVEPIRPDRVRQTAASGYRYSIPPDRVAGSFRQLPGTVWKPVWDSGANNSKARLSAHSYERIRSRGKGT